MTSPWIVTIPKPSTQSLTRLRQFSELELACDDTTYWVRVNQPTPEILQQIRSLPDAQRFQLQADGQLIEDGRLVPRQRLPQLDWMPIRQAISPQLPPTRYAGRLHERANLQLVRSREFTDANLVMTSLENLMTWADHVLSHRLDPLRWACQSDGTCLIHGVPLPSVPGQRFYESQGIAVPVGQTWAPHLTSSQLAEQWHLQTDDLCLWTPQKCEIIPASSWTALTRSALVLTAERLLGESPHA